MDDQGSVHRPRSGMEERVSGANVGAKAAQKS